MNNLRIIGFLWLLSVSAIAQNEDWFRVASDGVAAASGGGGTSVPTIVQSISMSSTADLGPANNTATWVNLPNPTKAGNALLVVFRNTVNSTSWKIVDEGGDGFGLATNIYANGINSMAWIATNIAAGTTAIGITNTTGSTSTNLAPRVYELNNVLAYNPLDAVGASSGTGTAPASSAITPTQSGDAVLCFVDYTTGANQSTNWMEGSQANISWALLCGDTRDNFGDEWGVYSSTASFSPTLTMQPSASWNAISIALKAAASAQGSPIGSGIQVASVLHQSLSTYAAYKRNLSMTNAFCVPGDPSCNLIVAQFGSGDSSLVATNITDTCGNVWTEEGDGPSTNTLAVTDWWFATNAICSPTNVVTIKLKGTNSDATILFHLVKGAGASPSDWRRYETGNSSGVSTLTAPSVAYQPAITNSLVFATAIWANNTGTNVTSGQRFLYNYFASENLDGPCNFDQNNGAAFTNTSTTIQQSFTWRFRSGADGPNQWAADVMAFSASNTTHGVAWDTFSRANETPLAGNWTAVPSTGGTMDLSARGVVPHSLASDSAYCWTGSGVFTADQWAQCNVVGNSGNTGNEQGIGVILRGSTSARTYYLAMADGKATVNISLQKFVGGTHTLLWTRAATYVANAPLRASIVGTTITVTYNYVAVGANTTDSGIATGKPGIGYSSTENNTILLDNWQAGNN